MDLALIERLIVMLGQSSLQSLDVTEGNLRIRLSKAPLAGTNSMPAASAQSLPEQETGQTGRVTIRAGMAGTFYRAPAPGAAPFVAEGDVIAEGQTLALIEAMKMLNPVEAEQAGRIVAIHRADGEAVAPGDSLFDLDPAITGPDGAPA